MPVTYRKRRVASRKRARRDKTLDLEIGTRVAELRVNKGMPQVELGRFLKRQDAAGQAHKLESGKSGFSLADLVKLADHFGVTLDYLIRGSETDAPLTNEEVDTVLKRYAASEHERNEFAAHRRLYRDHRITTSYVHVFLLVLRRDRPLEEAADAALNAQARDSAKLESGEATRVPPDALRKRRKR
jgi:transcriptional regulator with XRE-family HTH domain